MKKEDIAEGVAFRLMDKDYDMGLVITWRSEYSVAPEECWLCDVITPDGCYHGCVEHVGERMLDLSIMVGGVLFTRTLPLSVIEVVEEKLKTKN